MSFGYKVLGFGSGGVGSPFLVATGGTIATVCTNYKTHTFTGPGTFTVCSAGTCEANNLVSYMVLAGGGSGAAGCGGAGGAGGFREVKSPVDTYTASPLDGYPTAGNRITVTGTGYPITVGGGGAGVPFSGPYQPGTVGSNSVFSTITSAGGGFGGGGPNAGAAITGGSGGSGGGGNPVGTLGSGNTPPVSPPQGQDGGKGNRNVSPSPNNAGGGGGGAGAAGANGSPSGGGGDGGAGITTCITATPVQRAGGGGGAFSDGPSGCNQGAGGGGRGGYPGAAATDGTVNTGGGGGAGGASPAVVTGAGGSGIVVIRYKFQ